MAYATRLYPRAKPRGFTLQWIKTSVNSREKNPVYGTINRKKVKTQV